MTRPVRVLHLEDSPRDAEMIRHRLDVEDVSCDILVANSKESFETALTREPFDLIISDYNLPGYNGVAALKHAQATQPDVPVILISGTVVEEQAVKCLHIGAIDYLLKDRLDRLVPAVRRALQEAETRRARQRVEAALGKSEARKAAILDSVLDCIVTIDASGTVIEFNVAAVRTFGYTKAEAIGRLLADLIIPPRFRERHGAGLARYLATGEGALIGKLVEIIAMRSDGTELPVELAITAIGSGSDSIFTGVLRDITARKHEEATRARLAAIVDSSDDAIFSMGLDGTILTWNGGAERLYGYAANEMIGRNRALLVPAGMSVELIPIMARAARGDPGQPLETRRRRKNGSVVDVSLVISPMADPIGPITSVSTIARDITNLKQAEASLRDERDRAQQYLDTAEVILLKLDVGGRILLVNRYACTVLGWTADELLARDWIETCLPSRIRNSLRNTFNNLVSGDLSIVENPVLTRSGDERLIEWRNTVLRDDAGQVIGTFSSGTDITERNQAVEALRTSEERMRFALEAASVGIWDMDYTTGVHRWSEILETQYCLQPGTFGGTFEAFIERVHPDDRESLLATVGKAIKSGGDFSTLHRTICPDGTVRWLSGAGRVRLGEDGEPVRTVGISLNVTERHTLEAQYQQVQKMEAIGRLAGGVAHDFNNLLTVILGFCELLLAGLTPEDPRQADVTEIQKAGARAAGLTRQLLAFSRKEIIQPTLLDLNVIVADIRVMLARLIGEDVTIVLRLGATLAPVKADRGQIEQIILNLAVNARDAMPKGGTLTVETANVELDEHNARTHPAVKPGRYIVLTVTDTGTGMTPEVQARLFEPFFTTKELGKGTGLGLATVFGIVTRSGGIVTVNSEVGRGTSFMVYLPRAHHAAPVVAAPPPVDHRRAGGQTVLVVEDAEGLRELTKRLLERQGYTVLPAANADEALQLFDEHTSIDLLLTDVVMPGASGPELVKQLVERRPTLKVIYMSGYTDDAIGHHGVLDAGIVFLHKPFSSASLGQKIREVLDR
jgi:two-component system cell cycle sensor histidine kinase/response regulator CckA